MKEVVTVEEAAKRLGMNPNGIRVQLQRGILPFGQAVPSVTGNKLRYIIPRAKFEEFMGNKK